MVGLSFGKLVRLILIFLFAVFCVIIVIWIFRFFDPGGVIDQKSVYAELQGVEIEYREQKLAPPFVLNPSKNRAQRIAGFDTADGHFPYAWIALTAENSDSKIYMVPGDAKIRISCPDADKFLQQNAAVAAVVAFLKDQCYKGLDKS